ncbi:trypsin inhibitor like cysteine rich domain-containing protein [Phthorimaea operculella]|nr:trypsin inhibitor like cysteine rich domain-containing protein [Phthorimaea operculella]
MLNSLFFTAIAASLILCVSSTGSTTAKCGVNECWQECPNQCVPRTCSEVGYPVACPLPASDSSKCSSKPGCVCIDGYVKNDKGECIPIKSCPACAGDENAVSGCGVCGRTCRNYNSTTPPPCPRICRVNSCDCRKGYVRDENTQKCVKPENCTPICGTNEHYETCPNSCQPTSCSQLGFPISCTEQTDGSSCPTEPGCVCDDNYVRADNGTCIPKGSCPSCGGDNNARSGCGNCPTTCSNYKIKDQIACIQICYANACDCKEGYVLDGNTKQCVEIKDCTPQCGQNETYSDCVNGGCHSGRTCDQAQNLNGSTICVRPIKCEKGCLCKEGYVRDSNGNCIPINECPYNKCSAKNHEHYEQCPDDCTPRTCSQVGYPQPCTSISSGGNGTCSTKPACVCDAGYVRDENGRCVPKEDCPSCAGDKNAVSGCGNCRKTCRNKNSTEPQICPLFCNLNGCDCRKGYVYDEDSKRCVLPGECTPTCGPDEVFNSCANGGCHGGRTCKQLNDLNGAIICVDPIECKKGCLCKKGYVRNSKGVCIPEYECPGKNCARRKHERYQECPNDCLPKKCSEVGFPVACPGQTQDGSCPVKPGCTCDDGYVRADNGTCIPIKQCPSCGGDENAQNGCGNCRKTCSNYNSDEPQICLEYCDLNGCDCKDGYVLDEILNKCVLPVDCSPPCGENEELDYCVNGKCNQAVTCKDLDTITGTDECTGPVECQRGCSCKYGYLRDCNGVCIPENKCPNSKCKRDNETYVPCNYQCRPETCAQVGYPLKCLYSTSPSPDSTSCGGDPNARAGCGGNCGRRCSDYNKGPVACPLICLLNGCDCIDGYVYDDNIKKCVRPEKCTQVCGMNEEYTSCVESCSESTCGEKSNAVSSRSRKCTSGCICREGYSRNSNGVCVPSDECSLNSKCTKKYQYYDTCPPNCVGETCASIGQVIDCPPQAAVCRPRCRCAEGYKIDGQGNCILESQCNQCGKNETYDYCYNPCPPRECGVNIAAVSCLKIEEKDCKGGCRCQDGYLRNKNGDCVAEGDCPPNNPCTKANEVYDVCPKRCPPGVCGIDDRLIDCAPQPLPGDLDCPAPACKCASGYYRDDKGECVKWENCPKCPKYEVYDPCGNPCPGDLCSTDERLIRCKAPPKLGDKDCAVGCRCQDGYKRNDKGKCVPKDQCPPRTPKCPVNEIYDTCKPLCPPQDCSVDETLILCLPNPKPGSDDCQAGCRCRDGYKRNADGVCIPKEQCPPICNGANEVWNPCPNPRDPNTCDSVIAGNCHDCANEKTTPARCKGQCTCKPGYYKNKIGECVSKEDCLKCKGQHEYFSCGGACDNVCATLSQQNQTNCPIINIKCNEMCYCEEGFARDSQGICVPIESCRNCKGPHEWRDNCPTGCAPNDSCDTYGKSYNCPNQSVPPKCGKPICRCETNYLRLNGTCVPQEQCPCNGDPNAQPGCGCSKTCADYYANTPPTCTKDCKLDACDCKDGYVRDTSTGKCVLPKDCPVPTCPQNEVFDKCPPTCPPETCPDGRLYKCVAPPKPGSDDCRGKCRCRDGYYRDSRGRCIPKEFCSLCKGPNESYACGGACDNVCATLSQQNQTNCPIINVKCNDMCYCDKDYARDSNGTCIPISSCPPSCNGDPNAQPGCCGQTCSTYDPNKTTVCNKLCTRDACQCKKGYALDEKSGKCVLPKNCPSAGCNGDPNAEPGCCGQTCSSYDPNKTPVCNKLCTKDACQCKKGYALDEASGKCVLPKNCPPSTSCNVNEEYSTCTQGSCRQQECSRKGQPVPCPAIAEGDCIKGCVCKNEYLRLKNGTCVHESLCPTTDAQPTQNGTSDDAALQALTEGVNIFSFKFFLEALKAKKGQNSIMSPFSAMIPMAQLGLAAENETKNQLLASLNLANKDQIRQAFPLLLDALKGSDGITFNKALRIYVSDDYPLLEEYIIESNKTFNATPENVNCRDSAGTANKINKWVEANTNNRIKDLISPDVINDLTRLILVNAIYFKGTWKKQFNVNDTKEQDFYTYDKRIVPVQMMFIETILEYANDAILNAQGHQRPPNRSRLFVRTNPQAALQRVLDELERSCRPSTPSTPGSFDPPLVNSPPTTAAAAIVSAFATAPPLPPLPSPSLSPLPQREPRDKKSQDLLALQHAAARHTALDALRESVAAVQAGAQNAQRAEKRTREATSPTPPRTRTVPAMRVTPPLSMPLLNSSGSVGSPATTSGQTSYASTLTAPKPAPSKPKDDGKKTPPPTPANSKKLTGCTKKPPPIVVDILPDWSHHFGELKKELGHAPNPKRTEAAPQGETNAAGSLMAAANGPDGPTKKRKPRRRRRRASPPPPQDVETPGQPRQEPPTGLLDVVGTPQGTPQGEKPEHQRAPRLQSTRAAVLEKDRKVLISAIRTLTEVQAALRTGADATSIVEKSLQHLISSYGGVMAARGELEALGPR